MGNLCCNNNNKTQYINIVPLLERKPINKALLINITSSTISINNYSQEDLIILDKNSKFYTYPTRDNIMKQLNLLLLIVNNNPNTDINFLIAYSGYGSSIIIDKENKDEVVQVIAPIDYQKSGFITGEYLKTHFLDKLTNNVTCTLLIDTFSSSPLLELRYNYTSTIKVIYDSYCNLQDSLPQIILIQGYTDKKTSAEAFLNPNFNTTVIFAFNECYKDNISWNKLIYNMKSWLFTNNTITSSKQDIKLSSGKYLKVDNIFSF